MKVNGRSDIFRKPTSGNGATFYPGVRPQGGSRTTETKTLWGGGTTEGLRTRGGDGRLGEVFPKNWVRNQGVEAGRTRKPAWGCLKGVSKKAASSVGQNLSGRSPWGGGSPLFGPP